MNFKLPVSKKTEVGSLLTLPNIKKEICYDSDSNSYYTYDYDLVKTENDDFLFAYEESNSAADTKENLFRDFETEVTSNSSEVESEQASNLVEDQLVRLYFCRKCNLQFLSKTGIIQHRIIFHSRKRLFRYLCLICKTRIPTKNKYSRHMEKHKICNYFYCSTCKMMFTKKREHTSHLISHLHTSVFCRKCNKYFRGKLAYKNHLSKFRKTFFCRLCNIGFFYLKCYEQHMIIHLRYDKLLKFRSRRKIKRCLMINTGIGLIKMNFASTPFKYRFHKNIYKKLKYHQKIYKCYKCLTTYTSRNNLKHYENLSIGRRRKIFFECPLCRIGYCKTKVAPSPSGCHTKQKLFSCGTCKLKFYNRSQKEKHLREICVNKLDHKNFVHKPDGPIKLLTCHICKWKFPDRAGLKIHIYFHHF